MYSPDRAAGRVEDDGPFEADRSALEVCAGSCALRFSRALPAARALTRVLGLKRYVGTALDEPHGGR